VSILAILENIFHFFSSAVYTHQGHNHGHVQM
jgi:hypothetical protein